MKSPSDIQPGENGNGNDLKNIKNLKSNANNKNNIFQEKESNWEASYVGKIKKQQKSRRSMNGTTSKKSSTTKKVLNSEKHSKSKNSFNQNLLESSEISIDEKGKKTHLGLEIEARMNSRGKVDVSLKGDRLDDEDEEEGQNMIEWINNSQRSEDEEEEEEEDD